MGVALLGQVCTFFCISYEFMNIRGNIMLCIFSMHFENVPALQSLINQILLYSYYRAIGRSENPVAGGSSDVGA